MNIEKKIKRMAVRASNAKYSWRIVYACKYSRQGGYVAIQFPIINGELLYKGRFGDNLSTEDGYKAMQQAALNVLSQINDKIGFDNIEGLNHMDAYYQSGEHWNEAPRVVDGASDLFLHVLGEQGTHSRAIFGVHKLYFGFGSQSA